MNNPDRQRYLDRRLGLGSATAAVAGEVIGVGIFLTPAGMARQLGSPFWLLIVWLFMGVMALAGALCFGGLAARFPAAGGAYVYLREAYGPRLAFLYGWMQLLVIDPGVTASLAVGMAAYTATIIHLSSAEQKMLGISAILILAAVNMRGARLGGGVLQLLTWLKIAALAFIPVWAIAFGRGNWAHFSPFISQRPGSVPLFLALAGGCTGAFYSFGGWWEATKISEEVRDPQWVMPRALVIGVSVVILVYILVSAVFIYLVPIGQIRSDETFMAQAGRRLFGPGGGDVMAALVVLCVAGSIAALMMLSPRVYYSMARDGLFFHAVAEVHPRFGTPAHAIAVQCVLASLLVLIGTFSQIVAYFVFVAVAFLGLTVAGIIWLRLRSPNGLLLRVPGYPYTPLAFLTLVAFLLVLLAAHNPLQAFLGVAVVSLGIPAFRLVQG
ncbi:MAG TPA: amino acid permease [Terriglobia bacterium]|jgi:APA family basic amino acid/polyamine antiporter|nr:amino acid permease [Terriglobia bacterium]